MKFATKAIHAGIEPDPSTGAIMTPIFQTSTYVQEAPGKHKGYEYARTSNPTRTTLEQNIAALENALFGVCFASGLAASDAVLKLFKPGDEIICTNDIYGGTYRMFMQVFQHYGIRFHYVDMRNATDIKPFINANTKLIWIETPTNPLLNIVDIESVCEIAKQHNLLVCVDNTFASPFLQNPINFGADMVLHSATKYISGHSDVIHGCVVTNEKPLAEKLHFIQKATGAVPSPFDCFLVLRGIKTLHIRVQRACENAEKIALFLHQHPKIGKVYWPGFSEHPNHDIAKKQMRMYGAMLSFSLIDDDINKALQLLSSTQIFSLAESLGGVESLIGHPASMTHASIPREERIKNGLSDTLIRLSVGIEDIDDLISDLSIALDKI
jgi:cystathionine gamma-lyase